MSRSLLHDWEYAIEKCCRENNQTGMIDIAEDIYNTAYVRGKNHSVKVKEALDKLRAEIKALSPEPTAYDAVYGNPVKDAVWETLDYVLKIIDKYEAESEET